MLPNLRSLVMVIYTLFLAAVAVAGLVVEPTGRLYMWFARRLWGKVVLWIGGIELSVKGGENLDWKRPYVVCSNHASQTDIPAIFGGLRMPLRFLAKRSLFYIPIFGWSMWLARFIPVDRAKGRKARQTLGNMSKKISDGPSLMVFPEGTRSADGRIKRFKSGAFAMAISASVPVLPVAIKGSFDVMPRDTVKVKPGRIELIVGTPVETEGMDMGDREGLRSRVQKTVQEMFDTGHPV